MKLQHFEDISRQIWPKLKQQRRQAMGVKISPWRLFMNRYENNPVFRSNVDHILFWVVSFILGIGIVIGYFYITLILE